MKLLLENWREYQLLTEAQDIRSLYESGQITEGEYLDKIKRFAKKKGIPIALALSLAGGVTAAAKAQTAQSWEDWHKEAIVAQAEYEEQHGAEAWTGSSRKKYKITPLRRRQRWGDEERGRGFYTCLLNIFPTTLIYLTILDMRPPGIIEKEQEEESIKMT